MAAASSRRRGSGISRTGRTLVDAEQGRSARLSLLPRARPATHRDGRGAGCAIAGDLPELPAVVVPGSSPTTGSPRTTPSSSRASVRWPTISKPLSPPARPPKAASNWVMGEMARKLNDTRTGIDAAPVTAGALAGLIALVEGATISTTTAKEVFEKMWASGRAAREIVDADGLAQISDESAIAAAVDGVIASHAETAAQIPRGPDQGARVPRWPGDEGDRRQSEPQTRQRARAARARAAVIS